MQVQPWDLSLTVTGQEETFKLPSKIEDLEGRLNCLTTLHFFECGLREIPESIKSMRWLQCTIFTRCDLTYFPSYLTGCRGLQKVEVIDNVSKIVIGKTTGDMTGLIELKIDGCAVDELPDAIGELTYLHSLSLVDNAITTIAEKLFIYLICLQKLSLSGNKLLCIPSAILEAQNLKELDLSNNIIYSASDELHTLPQLTLLNLAGNRLRKFPEKLHLCKRLEFLNIARNPLKKLGSLPKDLKMLDITCCRLESIPLGLFCYTNLTKVAINDFICASLAVYALAQNSAKVDGDIVQLWGNQIPINSLGFTTALINVEIPIHLCKHWLRQPDSKQWNEALTKCNPSKELKNLPALKNAIEEEFKRAVSWKEFLHHLVLWKSTPPKSRLTKLTGLLHL